MSTTRKLAAIMFSDILGYTAIMAGDELKALTMLDDNRANHQVLIASFNGQLVKEIGDGILAAFENSSDAVLCAAAIQNASKKSEIPLRVGIHQGETVFQEGKKMRPEGFRR